MFEVTRDRAFAEIVRLCAEREETWINAEIEASYIRLHEAGRAHSIEVWQDGALAGGLYGVRLGAAFFGESMVSLVARRLEGRPGLAGGAADRRRLPAARLPVHDRRICAASARSRSTRRTIWRCWTSALGEGRGRRRGAGAAPSPAGAGRVRGARPAARRRGPGRRRRAAARMGHRAALGPDVVDRVLDDVERRRFLVEPARKDPLELALRVAHVELDEGAGQLLHLPGRGRLAGAQPDDHVADAHRLAGPQASARATGRCAC